MEKKKEHILFLCNTYMQLISAIQIKRKLFSNVTADLLISNHSISAKAVAVNLAEIKLFERVKVVDTQYYVYQQNKLQDFLDIIRLSFHIGKKYKKYLFQDNCIYDKIFYFNLDFLLYTVMDLCKKQNKKPELCRMEEGLHSYRFMLLGESNSQGTRLPIIARIRKILHKDCIFKNTHDFYVYFDWLFPECDGVVHKIPNLSKEDKELIHILNDCFDYKPEIDIFEEKYIFFGSSREIDGFETEETKVIYKIAEKVGKDNLLVKTHPRDGRKVYQDYGIKVSKKSNVPWEVIQLNHDFSNHIFITMSSGSVICASALLGDVIPTYLLYPIDYERDMFYNQFCEENLEKLLIKLQNMGMCTKHKITGTLSDIPIERS